MQKQTLYAYSEVYEKKEGIPLDPRRRWNPIYDFRYDYRALEETYRGQELTEAFWFSVVACSFTSVGLIVRWEQRSWDLFESY